MWGKPQDPVLGNSQCSFFSFFISISIQFDPFDTNAIFHTFTFELITPEERYCYLNNRSILQ